MPAGADGPYFLDLVVLFLVVDFFAPPFAADLLLAFFAMALTSFLVRQIYGARNFESMNFFSWRNYFQHRARALAEGSQPSAVRSQQHGAVQLLTADC